MLFGTTVTPPAAAAAEAAAARPLPPLWVALLVLLLLVAVVLEDGEFSWLCRDVALLAASVSYRSIKMDSWSDNGLKPIAPNNVTVAAAGDILTGTGPLMMVSLQSSTFPFAPRDDSS